MPSTESSLRVRYELFQSDGCWPDRGSILGVVGIIDKPPLPPEAGRFRRWWRSLFPDHQVVWARLDGTYHWKQGYMHLVGECFDHMLHYREHRTLKPVELLSRGSQA
jgi:hypothetical protein